ncbi:MAG TPA: type II toxin-antitoxin system MqsA family antitoxin [Gammaproteobacteria bacterium]|nr:type II toxin-antitoxin system MqsA family antitoxin [Gammaproteobacteria bacterium]
MTTKEIKCPACEVGQLEERTCEEEFKYKDIPFVIHDYLYSICSECGSELVLPSQAKINTRAIKDEHRLCEGFLSSTDIKKVRKKYKLTQSYAADIFGGGPNAFSKYENGDVIQSKAMDKLLRVTDQVPGVFSALVQMQLKGRIMVDLKKSFVGSCDYGECTLSGSRSLSPNVFYMRDSIKSKKRKWVQPRESRKWSIANNI